MNRTAKTTAVILIVLAIVACEQVRAGDMFSQGFAGIGSSSKPSDNVPSPSQLSGPRRLSLTELKTSLTQLGYEVKQISERLYGIKVKRDTWTLPVIVEMTSSGKKLWFSIRLTTLKGEPNQHLDRVLKLLSLGGAFGPEFFGYSEKSRGIILYMCRENDSLTNVEIKQILEHMSFVAVKTAPTWDVKQAAPPAKHVGTWRFQNDSVTITVALDKNGQFRLQNSSGTDQSGTYSIDGGKLVLVNKSERLELAMQWSDSNHLTLTFGDQNIPFVRT